ncbi:hypothetical protein JCM2811A_29960 [Methylorubrum rhodinum]
MRRRLQALCEAAQRLNGGPLAHLGPVGAQLQPQGRDVRHVGRLTDAGPEGGKLALGHDAPPVSAAFARRHAARA